MKTKNIYALPLSRCHILRISKRESPAHVGPLKQSIDFIVPQGVPVKAALDGVVIDLKDGSTRGGTTKKFEKHGNFVEIKHKNGEYSIYEHLRKGLCVKLYDNVKKGQTIGYTGATGWLAHLGPHLHFMVGIYNYRTLEIRFEKERFAKALKPNGKNG